MSRIHNMCFCVLVAACNSDLPLHQKDQDAQTAWIPDQLDAGPTADSGPTKAHGGSGGTPMRSGAGGRAGNSSNGGTGAAQMQAGTAAAPPGTSATGGTAASPPENGGAGSPAPGNEPENTAGNIGSAGMEAEPQIPQEQAGTQSPGEPMPQGDTGGSPAPETDPDPVATCDGTQGLVSVRPSINVKDVTTGSVQATFATFRLAAQGLDFLLDSFRLHLDCTLIPTSVAFDIYKGSTHIAGPLAFAYAGGSYEFITVENIAVLIPRYTTVELTVKGSVSGAVGARMNVAMDNPGIHATGSDGTNCTPIVIDHYYGGIQMEGVNVTAAASPPPLPPIPGDEPDAG